MQGIWVGEEDSGHHSGRWAALLCLVVLLLFCLGARGVQSVSLAWNPDTDPGVAGYNVYYGTSTGQYSSKLGSGTNTTATITGLKEGTTNYFAVSAYNSAGVEGPRSAEIHYIVPGLLVIAPTTNQSLSLGMPVPGTLRFPVAAGHNYAVQATQDFKTWTTISTTGLMSSNQWWTVSDPASARFRFRFYRLATDPTNSVVTPPTNPPPIQLTAGAKAGSAMVVEFAVAPGHWYAIQATQDFKTWITIGQTATITTNGVMQISDPASVVLRYRYYRLATH
jgi:hypothetical protein